MGKFSYQLVGDVAKELYIRALKVLPPDVREALKRAYEHETSPTARTIFETIFKSIEISDTKDMLICQDTGLPIYMVEIGGGFPVDGAKIKTALAEGARRATVEYPFRGSSLHPVTRENPQTSIGEGLPIIYWDFNPEADYLDILMMPKGVSAGDYRRRHRRNRRLSWRSCKKGDITAGGDKKPGHILCKNGRGARRGD